MSVALTSDMVRSAVVDRDAGSVTTVVQTLTPIVQRRVAVILLRRRTSAHGRDLRQEIEDMMQEVFEFLLADGGRRMLGWDPERGAAATYFGLIAERCVINLLASRRRSPWTEDPAEEEILEKKGGANGRLEDKMASREILRELGRRLIDGLSERDRTLFEMLYIQQADDATVRTQLGIGRDALYQARRRLLDRVRRLAAEIGPEVEQLVGVGS